MTDLVIPEPCVGSKFHSPTPLVTHPFDLAAFEQVGFEPGYEPKDPVRLCGVCSDNLQVLLDLLRDGVPWETQRRFGNRIRGLAKKVLDHQEGT